MAMGREGEVQGDLMMTWAEMPRSPGHVFYDRLQRLLGEAGFDAFVEEICKPYYAPRWARLRCRRVAISACI
jgi:transposase